MPRHPTPVYAGGQRLIMGNRLRRVSVLASACVLVLSGCTSPSSDLLEPGRYSSPLVQLQQLVGQNSHLHTDEVRYRASDAKLFHCCYTFGVIDARDPARMVYLAQNLRHTIPVDVIVDRNGTIVYVAREYDPGAMEAVIEKLLHP